MKFASTYSALHMDQQIEAHPTGIRGVDSGLTYLTGDPVDFPMFEEIARRWNGYAELSRHVERMHRATKTRK